MIETRSIRVGPAGWSYADWTGVVYPTPAPRGFHPLPLLARSFDCIEINGSFYAAPRPADALRWRRLVLDHSHFRFIAKLGRVFTHDSLVPEAVFVQQRNSFAAGIEPLGDRLTALLLQFPLSFRDHPQSRFRLDRLRDAFGERSLVVELRHRSWFEPDPLAWIERSGFSLAWIDLPSSPDHPPGDPPSLGPIGYLRLHGRNAGAWFDPHAGRDRRYDYLYDAQEIEALAGRARRLAEGKDQTFVITNNHFAGKAVANALDILHALRGEQPIAPPGLVEHFPHLAAITRSGGQGSLY